MSIKDKIELAQAQAATNAALEGLGEHRLSVIELNGVLEKHYDLELVLSQNGPGSLLVMPIDSKMRTRLEDELMDSIKNALKGCRPRLCDVDGYAAYRTSDAYPLQGLKEVCAGGLHFRLDIVMQDLNTETLRRDPAERKHGKRNAIKRESLPISEYYIPQVAEDFRFQIDKTRNNPKYPLLPVNKSIRPYFPGLGIPFYIIYRGEETLTHVACASQERRIGELAGNYISEGMTHLFKSHPEIRAAGILPIRVVTPGKTYEILSKL